MPTLHALSRPTSPRPSHTFFDIFLRCEYPPPSNPLSPAPLIIRVGQSLFCSFALRSFALFKKSERAQKERSALSLFFSLFLAKKERFALFQKERLPNPAIKRLALCGFAVVEGNGKNVNSFKILTGSGQKDPISSILFLIATEPLN